LSLEQTPHVFTSNLSQGNRFQYTPYGMALLTGGLVQIVSINGVGLVTGGFIWQGPAIWFDPDAPVPLVTGWTACAGYSGCAAASLVATGWTAAAGYSGAASASLVSTVWALSQSFGDEFPIS